MESKGFAELVAPHAGAWIETEKSLCDCQRTDVAPHAGAWIETEQYAFHRKPEKEVAPHAGAWIETKNRVRNT